MLDDTCYSLACDSEEEAVYLKSLLDSDPAQEFYASILFPDAKRPVTVDLLRRLDLLALARLLGSEARLTEFLRGREAGSNHGAESCSLQPALFG